MSTLSYRALEHACHARAALFTLKHEIDWQRDLAHHAARLTHIVARNFANGRAQRIFTRTPEAASAPAPLIWYIDRVLPFYAEHFDFIAYLDAEVVRPGMNSMYNSFTLPVGFYQAQIGQANGSPRRRAITPSRRAASFQSNLTLSTFLSKRGRAPSPPTTFGGSGARRTRSITFRNSFRWTKYERSRTS